MLRRRTDGIDIVMFGWSVGTGIGIEATATITMMTTPIVGWLSPQFRSAF
jgi:hypothetical protein